MSDQATFEDRIEAMHAQWLAVTQGEEVVTLWVCATRMLLGTTGYLYGPEAREELAAAIMPLLEKYTQQKEKLS